jgi:hypothetical protein
MAKPKTTEEALRYWEMHSPVMEAFPILFKSGSRLQEFHGNCLRCDVQIPVMDLRGSLTLPLPSVVTIEAIGLCRECMLLTPFLARIRDDLTLEFIDNESRQWVCVKPTGPTARERLVRLLSRFLRG